jgi:hypothetical protein
LQSLTTRASTPPVNFTPLHFEPDNEPQNLTLKANSQNLNIEFKTQKLNAICSMQNSIGEFTPKNSKPKRK